MTWQRSNPYAGFLFHCYSRAYYLDALKVVASLGSLRLPSRYAQSQTVSSRGSCIDVSCKAQSHDQHQRDRWSVKNGGVTDNSDLGKNPGVGPPLDLGLVFRRRCR